MPVDIDDDYQATNNLTIENWEWVDVEGAGVDATGTEDIAADVESLVADNRLLVFPPGTYLVDSPIAIDGTTNFGLYCPEGGATFTEGSNLSGDETHFNVGTSSLVSEFVMAGFESDTTTATFLELFAESAHVSELTFTNEKTGVGTNALSSFHIAGGCYATDSNGNVVPPNGKMVFENVDMLQGGAAINLDSDDPGGFYIGGNHAGAVEFRDCHVGAFPNNGIYASDPAPSSSVGGNNGPVRVYGGSFENGRVSNIRIGGDGSVVRDAVIRLNNVKTGFDPDASGSFLRGVWVRRGHGHVIENVRVVIDTGAGDDSLEGIGISPPAGRVAVRDCHITVNDPCYAVKAVAYDGSRGDTGVILDGVTVEGSADATGKAFAAWVDRANSSVRDVTVRQPNRWGLGIAADNVTVEGGFFEDDGTAAVSARNVTGATIIDPVLASGSAIDVTADATNTEIETRAGYSAVTDSGTLTVVNGWGRNTGPPGSTGQWNGNGYEGVHVRDTLNGSNYVYIDGAWRST